MILTWADLSINHGAKDHRKTCDICDTMEERRELRVINRDPSPDTMDVQRTERALYAVGSDRDAMEEQRAQRSQRALWIVKSDRDRLEEGRAQYTVNSDRLETARIQLPNNMDYHVMYNDLWKLSTTAGMLIAQADKVKVCSLFSNC
jgi:hypothetical protein